MLFMLFTPGDDAPPDAFEARFNELLLFCLLAVQHFVERADLEVAALTGEPESDARYGRASTRCLRPSLL